MSVSQPKCPRHAPPDISRGHGRGGPYASRSYRNSAATNSASATSYRATAGTIELTNNCALEYTRPHTGQTANSAGSSDPEDPNDSRPDRSACRQSSVHESFPHAQAWLSPSSSISATPSTGTVTYGHHSTLSLTPALPSCTRTPTSRLRRHHKLIRRRELPITREQRTQPISLTDTPPQPERLINRRIKLTMRSQQVG